MLLYDNEWYSTENNSLIQVQRDRDAENPRDWDNIGTLFVSNPLPSLSDRIHLAEEAEAAMACRQFETIRSDEKPEVDER